MKSRFFLVFVVLLSAGILSCGDGDKNPVADLESLSCYKDKDGDGFGDSATETICKGDLPVGYTRIGGDCDDSDVRVFPGQKEFFITPRSNGSFDFDCSGNTEIKFATVSSCVKAEDPDGNGCRRTEGWYSPNKLIFCGQSSGYVVQTSPPNDDPAKNDCPACFPNGDCAPYSSDVAKYIQACR